MIKILMTGLNESVHAAECNELCADAIEQVQRLNPDVKPEDIAVLMSCEDYDRYKSSCSFKLIPEPILCDTCPYELVSKSTAYDNKSLMHMSHMVQAIAAADYIYFNKGWESLTEPLCRILYTIAARYNKRILERTENSEHNAADNVIIGGTYHHFKGCNVTVRNIARDHETTEPVVIYEHEDGTLWARPLAMFVETVCINGSPKPRFEYVKSDEPAKNQKGENNYAS